MDSGIYFAGVRFVVFFLSVVDTFFLLVYILFSFFPSTYTRIGSERVLVGRRKIGIEEKILW